MCQQGDTRDNNEQRTGHHIAASHHHEPFGATAELRAPAPAAAPDGG